ncbi:hypothetical protein D3C81_2143510 [compost metagenome]
MLSQRHRRPDLARQFGAIAQKEEQQVKHDEKTHHKFEGALTETECLTGEKLAALHRTLDDFLT